MTDGVRRLLAGYATNTLTESERRELFDASLHDPALFEALADEQALRELLDDPVSRAELLAQIEPAPLAFRDRFAAWLRRPVTAAVLGTAAVAITAVSILPLLHRTRSPLPVQEVAKATMPSRDEAAVPLAAAPQAFEIAPSTELRGKRKPKQEAPAQVVANRPARPESEIVAPAAPAEVTAASEAKSVEPRLAEAAVESLAYRQAAKKADSGFRYAVLKRSPNGDYIEVRAGTEFEPGDTVRVRVETSRPSLVTIVESDVGRTLFSRQSTGTVETGDILLTADHTLEITETPLPSLNAVPGGVVGGFPSAMLQDKLAERSAPAVAARKVVQTPSVTLLLRVKKR